MARSYGHFPFPVMYFRRSISLLEELRSELAVVTFVLLSFAQVTHTSYTVYVGSIHWSIYNFCTDDRNFLPKIYSTVLMFEKVSVLVSMQTSSAISTNHQSNQSPKQSCQGLHIGAKHPHSWIVYMQWWQMRSLNVFADLRPMANHFTWRTRRNSSSLSSLRYVNMSRANDSSREAKYFLKNSETKLTG